jgi:hypothetical protein
LLRVVLAVGICLAASGAAGAEERSKLEPPDPERYRRWGPIRARPGFAVTDFGYDNNILVATDDRAVGDLTITVSPRLDGLVLLGRSAFLTFRERFSYTAYRTYTDQNYPANRFESRVTLPFRRMGVFAEVGLDNLQLRPTDLQDIRTRERDRRLKAGFILEPGWRTELEISQVYRNLTYTDPDELPISPTIGERLDREESGLELQVAWRAAGRTKLLFESRVESIDFRVPAFVGDFLVDRDGDAWRALTGVRFGEGGPLQGEARVGWAQFTANEPRYPEFSDWIGDLSLIYRLGARTRLIFTGERLPNFSVLIGSPYYLNTEFGVRAVHYLTRIIGVEGAALRGRVTFPGSFALEERIDDLFYYDVGVRFRVTQREDGGQVTYSARLRTYDRESTVPGVARTRTTFWLGAIVGF